MNLTNNKTNMVSHQTLFDGWTILVSIKHCDSHFFFHYLLSALHQRALWL